MANSKKFLKNFELSDNDKHIIEKHFAAYESGEDKVVSALSASSRIKAKLKAQYQQTLF